MRRIHRSLFLILIIAVSAIIWDYHSRNLGTSLLFKSSDFPYGIQPRLYGNELQLFTTAENCIIIGNYKGQKPKSDTKSAYIEDIIRYAHNSQDLVVEYVDSSYNLHYMQLEYENGSYSFSYLENGKDYFFLKPGYHIDWFGEWDLSGLFKIFLIPATIFFLLIWPFFYFLKSRRYLLFLPLIICSSTFIVSDFLINKYSETFESLCFSTDYSHSIFIDITTPEEWKKFDDPNDPEFYYTLTSSFSKDKSYVIKQYYKNSRINIIKEKYDYDGSEEFVDQKTAISLLKESKTFWGDVHDRCEFTLAFIRFFSIVFAIVFVVLLIISLCKKYNSNYQVNS